MPEIIDDAIPDADLWELFTGCRKTSCLVAKDQLKLNITISQGEFEIVRDTVFNAPIHGHPDHLLRLMWIRASKFGMPPLHDGNLLAFFVNAFALAAESYVRDEGVRRHFSSLLKSGYVVARDVQLKSGWAKSYPLSISGRKTVEKWFANLIIKSGTLHEAPYCPVPITEDIMCNCRETQELTAVMKKPKLKPLLVDAPTEATQARTKTTINTRSTQRENYDSLPNESKKAMKQNAALEACKKENVHINIRDIEVRFGLPEKSLNRDPYKSIIKMGRSGERQARGRVRKTIRKDRTRRGRIKHSED